MRRIPKYVFYFFDGYFLFILLTIFTGISLLTLDDRTVSTSAQSAHKLESVWKHPLWLKQGINPWGPSQEIF